MKNLKNYITMAMGIVITLVGNVKRIIDTTKMARSLNKKAMFDKRTAIRTVEVDR